MKKLIIGAAALIVLVLVFQNIASDGGSGNAQTVQRATFEGTWPFTVDEAIVTCDGVMAMVQLPSGQYGLNGATHGVVQNVNSAPERAQMVYEGEVVEDVMASVSDMIRVAMGPCK